LFLFGRAEKSKDASKKGWGFVLILVVFFAASLSWRCHDAGLVYKTLSKPTVGRWAVLCVVSLLKFLSFCCLLLRACCCKQAAVI
jgi:hypothetical protein